MPGRPPLRLATGSIAVPAIRAALQARLDEVETWAATAEVVDGVPVA